MLYRTLGHLDEAGAFISPLSYPEAQQMDKRQLDIFFELDSLAAKTIKLLTKNKGK